MNATINPYGRLMATTILANLLKKIESDQSDYFEKMEHTFRTFIGLFSEVKPMSSMDTKG